MDSRETKTSDMLGINKDQIKKQQDQIMVYLKKVKDILQKKQSDSKLIAILAAIAMAIFLYQGFGLYSKTQTLNQQSSMLNNIDKYDIQLLRVNNTTKNIVGPIKTLEELIKSKEEIKEEIKRYKKYEENLQLPYTNFLQYILLPKLNIWKELYTDKLNINILGGAYLEKNPYNDINLFQKWTDFFSATNKNQINEIKELKIGDVTDNGSGLFSIHMSFGFVAPSKSALLLLTDKITTTSDKENISLFGEFFYYLRQQIKTDKKEAIEDAQKEFEFTGDNNIDKTIGYEIYNRVFKDKETNLIDDITINKTIQAMMECKPDEEAQCYYRFRDKYRNIGELAYSIGDPSTKNKTEKLKKLIYNLPPLIAIKRFTYNKIQTQSLIQQQNTKYEGEIELEIYGQNISDEDMKEISLKLGKQCLGDDNKELSIEEANKTIDESIRNKESIIENSEGKINTIRDIKNIIETIKTDYDTLDNYKKTIKLFEIYRMLNESGLCKAM